MKAQNLKSLSLHIGIFGRTNAGKSTLINYITGQETSIVSEISGTTTDVVYKTMEILPIGPVTLIDTAGIDDKSALSEKRIEKTENAMNMADVAIIVLTPNEYDENENNLVKIFTEKKVPFLFVINNYKKTEFTASFKEKIKDCKYIETELKQDELYRDNFLNILKKSILEIVPEESLNLAPLTNKIIKNFQTVVMVVPIDLGAPKGRLILPQVQMIRACLDINAIVMIVKETELQQAMNRLKNLPDIVICDSQVIKKVSEIVPQNVALTTFSIIFSANRSDFNTMLNGIEAIKKLNKESKILIAEACTHHASTDDIGRVKIPKLLSQYLGFDVNFDVASGADFPKNLKEYSLIIHCGGCMINKKLMISRLNTAVENKIPITNYGMILSFLNNSLERTAKPLKK